MTLTWILVGITLLLIALQIRAMTRLIPLIFKSNKITILYALSCILIFSVLVYQWNWHLFYASFFGATTIAFALFDFPFGFCVYLAFIIFRPWELWSNDTIFLLIPRLGAIGTISQALVIYFKEKKINVLKKSLQVVLFFIWAAFTSIKSPLVGQAFSENILVLLPSLVLFLLVQFWITDRSTYDLITDSLAMSIIVTAILAIINHVSAGDDQGRLETMGILSNSNDIAAMCVLALPFALKPLISPALLTPKKLYPIYLLMALPLIIVIYYAQSRGATLALASVIGGIFFLKFKIKWYTALLFLIISLGAVNYVSHLREGDDIQQSTESRLSYWEAGLKMAVYNPILGVGMGRYPNEYENYSSEHLYEFGQRTAHNSWILIFAETGFLGIFLFGGIFLYALKEAFHLRVVYPEVFLSLFGYMIAMTFLSHSYLFYPYLILGVAFAIIRIGKPLVINTVRET